MKIRNVNFTIPYWDEGQGKKLVHWYRKGFWKKAIKKRWIKSQIKYNDE